MCRPEQKNSYGGAKGLTSEVECHVESKPGATSFRWTFNGTGELVDLTSGYRTTADGSISILRYTPRSEMDFGTLLCWAANPLGLQSQPCVFHFYAAGKNLKFNSNSPCEKWISLTLSRDLGSVKSGWEGCKPLSCLFSPSVHLNRQRVWGAVGI